MMNPTAEIAPKHPATKDQLPEMIAAIDLGSNSFHLVISRVINGQLLVIDRLKDMVRLAGGLNDANELSAEAKARALNALQIFGERLQGMPTQSVRAVGTNTLRKARDSRQFLMAAQKALGHPIEIISGLEEARLVYLGVAYSLQTGNEKRLVIDIGGGSTEFIIGQNYQSQYRESKFMGCVGYSTRFVPDGKISIDSLNQAVLAARQELEPIEKHYKKIGWDVCIGASGTIKAVGSILKANGWTDGSITLEGMQKIFCKICQVNHVDKIQLSGLSQDRIPVFPAGLTILMAAFESLGIERMLVSDGALREGLMVDLFDRIQDIDVRDMTVQNMCTRYQVDMEHARRVQTTALLLLKQVAPSWSLTDMRFARLLGWAAQLHEIGLAITHSNYHKHGSYLVENSDMPGFSNQEQQVLWAMVRSHRSHFKVHRFVNAPAPLGRAARRLCILLRLAVVLNRSRCDDIAPDVDISVKGRKIHLCFPDDWLDNAPLSRANLNQEIDYLRAANFTLDIA